MESIVRKPLLLVNFTFVNLLEYCDVINAAHACENDYRHVIIKGQTLFKEHFVTDIRFKSDEETRCHYVQARVKAEMKKRFAYIVTGVISYNGKVIEGECQCAGGCKPACCKHLFVLLSALEDYSRKEIYAAPTDKIQTWHQPAPKAISPQKTKDSFRCDKTGLTNFDTSVSMSALPQNTPIFSVLQADPKKLTSDIIFYDRTIPLPAFVLSDLPAELPLFQIVFYHEKVRKNLDEQCCKIVSSGAENEFID